jgi:hypothetical protein
MNFFFGSSIVVALLFLSSCESARIISNPGDPVVGAEMFIFQTDLAYPVNNAGINSRVTSTAECQNTCDDNAVAWGIDCTNVVSLLSFGAADEVQDLPTTATIPTDKEIYSPDGDLIATDFTDLVDDRDVAMIGNGFAVDRSWTGFDGGGATTFNCDDWTNTGAIAGNFADVNSTGDWHQAGGCGGTRPFLCLSWQ